MKRPDVIFGIRVSPIYRVTSCAVKLAEEARGMYGFHSYTTCPDCKVEFSGWEFWGENGHLQFSARTREQRNNWIARKAREQWKTPDGIKGYKFAIGGALYYRAN